MKYGLIGEHLGHSFSKEIHVQLASYQYDLMPLTKDEFKTFMENKAFDAINVTIPYKQMVLPYIDTLDEKAKRVGAVNTIVHRDNQLFGYNTDYDGFLYTLQKHNIPVHDKCVLVLGDGGAAQAIKAVLIDEGAKKILSTRRTKTADTYTLAEVENEYKDVIDVIINTSPCGMYPNIDDAPCDLRDFPNCQGIVDLIYNPICTRLGLQAKALGIPFAGGLEMLVAQAKVAVTHFTGKQIDNSEIDRIYHQLLKEKNNLVMIGMPSCGKTTIGRTLAALMYKEFIDIDEAIVKKEQRSIKDIIHSDGEPAFRKMEHAMVKEVSKKQNCIIATGGGVIKNEANMGYLQMNGIILHLHRNIELLLVDKERPLSSSKEAVQKLYEERLPYYEKYSCKTVYNDTDIDSAIHEMIAAYDDALNK